MSRLGLAPLFGALLALGTGCTVGDGSGWVKSDRLFVSECWNGPFDLQPDFFAANPYREEALMIRVQRGDNNTEASDGLTVIVNDLAKVKIGEPIPVGVPNGVAPPGQPLTGAPNPLVTLSIYLHQTCHEQNSATYSVSGEIRFDSIFSGNLNEKDSEKRLTNASFSARFADPRDLVDAEDPAAVTSEEVTGQFSFYFQRGQPAQPFQ
ncbi:MAG: hypothetical protein EOO73_14115 [Myxococcales bacterium]|nr:MAG: hypothetical protein EOO73_14115 [Myxococcales bacterium]